jgi:hypothetical protein|tara:strand:+ start:173 stop:403 length:231 start_codon:yes stop_codon:yes gene_type:complete
MIHHKRHFSVQNITERERERKKRESFCFCWCFCCCEEEKRERKNQKFEETPSVLFPPPLLQKNSRSSFFLVLAAEC